MQVETVKWRGRSEESGGGESLQERTGEARATGAYFERFGFAQNDYEKSAGSPWRGNTGAGTHVREEEMWKYDQRGKFDEKYWQTEEEKWEYDQKSVACEKGGQTEEVKWEYGQKSKS